jgi:hypothetical protein
MKFVNRHKRRINQLTPDFNIIDGPFGERTAGKTPSSKHQRIPKQQPEGADRKIRDRKMETRACGCQQPKRRLASIYFSALNFFCHSVFGFPSSFDFRISDFSGAWMLELGAFTLSSLRG